MRTKQKILNWKREIDELKEVKYKAILEEDKKISGQVTSLFKRLQSQDYQDSKEFQSINLKIETLNNKSKAIKKDYQQIMQKKFSELYQSYPAIFDLLVNNNVETDTLNHVLDTFDRVEQGELKVDQGLNNGMDFLTDKYRLPDDFFNKTGQT